ARLRELAAAVEEPVFRIIVFGEFDQGKSTLLNALLGADLLPTSVAPTTAVPTEIRYGDEPRAILRVRGEDRPLDSIEQPAQATSLENEGEAPAGLEAVSLEYPAAICREEVILYDTPGLNERAEQDEVATRAVDLADLILFVVDIRRLGTLNERTVLEQWLQIRGLDAVVIVANFVNLVPAEGYADLRARLAAFAARWGCPYLPESSFEVDALGGLRARLDGDAAGWERSGMGRLEATVRRSTNENRQLLRQRSRIGRLRAFARELIGRLRDEAATSSAAA